VDTFSPYSKKEKGKEVKEYSGNGIIVMHGTRLDVDDSLRTSDVNKRLKLIEDRLTALEDA
jgi:hypothetical protein